MNRERERVNIERCLILRNTTYRRGQRSTCTSCPVVQGQRTLSCLSSPNLLSSSFLFRFSHREKRTRTREISAISIKSVGEVSRLHFRERMYASRRKRGRRRVRWWILDPTEQRSDRTYPFDYQNKRSFHPSIDLCKLPFI